MKISKFKFIVTAVVSIAAVQLGFVSCSDDPGVENYYTSTTQYATDLLKDNEQFSLYVQILERATGESGNLRLVDLLATYGSYTVFAPTNDAVDVYLASKGVSSVAELPKEDCDTIALNSIIENAYFTTDVNAGTYPESNMLDQYLSISCDSDLVSNPGQVTLTMYINQSARILHADDSVANGVVHTVNKVVLTSNEFIAGFLENNPQCALYSQALKETHVDELLAEYIDPTYSVGSDSVDWTNDALVMPTASEYDNVAYPKKRYYKFTMFVCPDSVLSKRYGITTLQQLEDKAHELYDPMYPEDAGISDRTDRRNALNRFISYHILDRYASYYQLTCVDGPGDSYLARRWNRNKWDIADWYETLMPYSILKCSFPNGIQSGLYINRRGVQSRADERGVFVEGVKVTPTDEMGVDNSCLNGIYHYIDGIIAYDQETQQVVLNERLRIDATTLSPDFMTSEARGHVTNSSNGNGKYGMWDNEPTHKNKNTCLGFKAGFVKNFTYDSNTHLHVRPRVLSFWSYQGDEVTILGKFDFTVKLPPVPAGTYELRLFTCVNFPNRGIIQVYIDGVPQGIPFDMRPDGTTLFGWKRDSDLGDEDAISAFDKSIHNLGWMKGPKSYSGANGEYSKDSGTLFRDLSNTIRKVLGTFVSDGKTEHYVRFQQKLSSITNAMNFDFIELCPSSVYNNEYWAEDRW